MLANTGRIRPRILRRGHYVHIRKKLYVTHFSDLGLAGALLRAVEGEGYSTPTPIQAQAIPYLMQGRDLLGIAQTGTGKTAAFALPILHKLVSDRKRPVSRRTRVLILAPTRELVSQIAESFRSYGRHAHMQIATVFGGVSYGPQVKALGRGLDILVATPGRLLDHLQQGTLKLDGTEIVVLDEADHMLDLGFIVPIREIVAKLPADRQTLFFSATMPKEIAGLAADMLDNPAQVAVKPEGTTAERVDQCVYMVEAGAKNALLVHLLKNEGFGRTMIFTRTKRGADRVATLLERENIRALAIHGNKSQSQREKALASFKRGSTQVLVATDIAARGIDVDGVTHVVNYELPDVPEAYVHRIGRTARAGADGKAIAFCAADERVNLRDIQKLTRMAIPAFVWSEDKGTSAIEAMSNDFRGASAGRRRPGGRNGSAKRREGGRERPAFGKDRAAGKERSVRPERAARPAEGRDARGGRDRQAASAKPAGQPHREPRGEAWGAPRGEPRQDQRQEARRSERPQRTAGGKGQLHPGKSKYGKGNNGKPVSGKAVSGKPGYTKPEFAAKNFGGEFTGGFTERQLNGKPNRPGQRRRRKMQAEREAMAAGV
jgi:ATP-dependent RNA helicase RhlE